eukprot:32839_1
MSFPWSSFDIRKLDFNPKVAEDVKKRTLSGGTVSLIGGLFIVWLFFAETWDYLSTHTVDRLSVDTKRGQKLRINVDIDFNRIPCELLSMDVMDSSGDYSKDVTHNVIMRRMDKDGKLSEQSKAVLANDVASEPDSTEEADYCGSCYGAEDSEGQCCNTCEEVTLAYHKRGWTLMNDVKQCQKQLKKDRDLLAKGEGCNVNGYFEVQKVAGNFHFVPGRTVGTNSFHIHDTKTSDNFTFDTTHLIRSLSFGETIPGVKSPLDGFQRSMSDGSGIFQYYTKVVPTTYTKMGGSTIESNQFSVTEHEASVQDAPGRNIAGVFFYYDLSPIKVDFTEYRTSFTHYLTQLCAIIGGVFTVLGMIDRVVYASIKSIETKMDLGKFT